MIITYHKPMKKTEILEMPVTFIPENKEKMGKIAI